MTSLLYYLFALYFLIIHCNGNAFHCANTQQCYSETLVCTANEPCTINCGPNKSCAYSTLNGQVATDVVVDCTAGGSVTSNCQAFDILCGTGNCTMSCGQDDSCMDAGLQCGSGPCILICNSAVACESMLIDTTSTSRFSCSGVGCSINGIPSPFVSPTAMPTLKPTKSPTMGLNLFAAELVVLSETIYFSILINTTTDVVKLTMRGPIDYWFGIGFNSSVMSGTYSIIVAQDDSYNNVVLEQVLGDHSYGSKLTSSITVLSDTETANNKRMAVIERNRMGLNSDYFTFPSNPITIDMIYAYGTSASFNPLSSMSENGANTLPLAYTSSALPTITGTSLPTVSPADQPTDLPTANLTDIDEPPCLGMQVDNLDAVFPSGQYSQTFNQEIGVIYNRRRVWRNGILDIYFEASNDWIITNGSYSLISVLDANDFINNSLPGPYPSGYIYYNHFPHDNTLATPDKEITLFFQCYNRSYSLNDSTISPTSPSVSPTSPTVSPIATDTTKSPTSVTLQPTINPTLVINVYSPTSSPTDKSPTETQLTNTIGFESTFDNINDPNTSISDSSSLDSVVYVVILILFVIPLILLLFGIMYHSKIRGSDNPNYLSVFRCFANIADFYTDIVFFIVLYSYSSLLWIPAMIFTILPHILSIIICLYHIHNWRKLQIAYIIANDNILIGLSVLFGFYATINFLTSKLFYFYLFSFQLSEYDRFKIRQYKLYNRLIENCPLVIIQIYRISDTHTDDKVAIIAFIFSLISLIINILTIVSRYIYNNNKNNEEIKKVIYKLDIRSSQIKLNHIYSHKLISLSLAHCMEISAHRIETLSILSIIAGITCHIEILLDDDENKIDKLMNNVTKFNNNICNNFKILLKEKLCLPSTSDIDLISTKIDGNFINIGYVPPNIVAKLYNALNDNSVEMNEMIDTNSNAPSAGFIREDEENSSSSSYKDYIQQQQQPGHMRSTMGEMSDSSSSNDIGNHSTQGQ